MSEDGTPCNFQLSTLQLLLSNWLEVGLERAFSAFLLYFITIKHLLYLHGTRNKLNLSFIIYTNFLPHPPYLRPESKNKSTF